MSLDYERAIGGTVIGVDEADRGPLVGGVYAAAVSAPLELADRLLRGEWSAINVKGDAKSLFIAAASILAKTARDADCLRLERLYPGYGIARHKGYPTAEHYAALAKLGPCPEHRRSFRLSR